MLHEDEFEVEVSSVRGLISEQFPRGVGLHLERVESDGTSNVLYRMGDQLVARFPRTEGAAEQMEKELVWLPRLAKQLPVPVPVPVVRGLPGEGFPRVWAVYEWLEGEAFPESGEIARPEFAGDLAEFLRCLQSIDRTGGPAPGAHNFFRGAPLRSRDEETRDAIDALDGRVDRAAVTEAWEASIDAVDDTEPAWIHGDLLPGNLLFARGRLSGVIDFGGLGVGDPACDLMPAWHFFSPRERRIFRDVLGVRESTWIRGRGWALSQALIYVPYYHGKRPRGVSRALRVIREIAAEQARDG